MLGTVVAHGILSVSGGYFLAGVGALTAGAFVGLPDLEPAHYATFLEGYAFVNDPHQGPRVPIGRGEAIAVFEDEDVAGVYLEASRALTALIVGNAVAPEGWAWNTTKVPNRGRVTVDGFSVVRTKGPVGFQVEHRFSPKGFRLWLRQGPLGSDQAIPYVVHRVTADHHQLEIGTEQGSFHLAGLGRNNSLGFQAETLGLYREVRTALGGDSSHGGPISPPIPS